MIKLSDILKEIKINDPRSNVKQTFHLALEKSDSDFYGLYKIFSKYSRDSKEGLEDFLERMKKEGKLYQLYKDLQSLNEIKVNNPVVTKDLLKKIFKEKFDANTWQDLRKLLDLTEGWMTVQDWVDNASNEELNQAYKNIQSYLKNK